MPDGCKYCGYVHTRNSETCSETCARGYRRIRQNHSLKHIENQMNTKTMFPPARVRWVLSHSPARFTLLQFVQLYRTQYGHRSKRPDPLAHGYPWKGLTKILTAEGAQQIGGYAVKDTRFANPAATETHKETPEPAKPSPAPAAPTSTIERLEARLSELQRVVDLQTKIKEVEAQIALF